MAGGEATHGVRAPSREEGSGTRRRRGTGRDSQFWTCHLMTNFLCDVFSGEVGAWRTGKWEDLSCSH